MSSCTNLQSIKSYINNKKQMIEEAFSCIPETQLNKMVPEELKCMSTENLKAACLEQVTAMSDKKILSILDGHELDSSSSAELELNNSDSFAKMNVNSRKWKRKQSEEEMKKHKKKIDLASLESDILELKEEKLQIDQMTGSKKGTEVKEKKYKKKKKKKRGGEDNSEEDNVTDDEERERKGRNLLELLELEMRAKAIRALLKQEERLEKEKKHETRKDEEYDGIREIEEKREWAEKWLDSNDVKRVVATSKMIRQVRSKMKRSTVN